MKESAALRLKFEREHAEYLKRIDVALDDVLSSYVSHPLYLPFKYALNSGKRLRPLVCLLVNESIGRGEIDVGPACTAVEILHTVSLIHDDFIDKAELRRELPPYYKKYGLESAFLVADFALGVVLSISSGYGDRRIGEELARTTIEMSSGEEEEREIVSSGKSIGFDEYIRILDLKTASLFRTAAKLGALLSIQPELAERMARFGREIGLAYQLKDDIKDFGQRGEITSRLSIQGRDEILNRLRTEASVRLKRALKELDGMGVSETMNKLRALLIDYF